MHPFTGFELPKAIYSILLFINDLKLNKMKIEETFLYWRTLVYDHIIFLESISVSFLKKQISSIAIAYNRTKVKLFNNCTYERLRKDWAYNSGNNWLIRLSISTPKYGWKFVINGVNEEWFCHFIASCLRKLNHIYCAFPEWLACAEDGIFADLKAVFGQLRNSLSKADGVPGPL